MICVDDSDGSVVYQKILEYPAGVIEETLPSTGEALPDNWALQDPDDYISVQRDLIAALLADTQIQPEQIRAIGFDFTNCTMMPVDGAGNVLCQKPEYRNNPHAWVKLWKHHAAEKYARQILEVASRREESWLKRYGNTVSAEWLFPKILQIFAEDRAIYDATDTFIEAVDWLAWRMTGKCVRSSATLGVNAFWNEVDGFPSDAFFAEIDPAFGATVSKKLGGEILSVGTPVGHLTPEFARLLGLTENTVVSTGHGDSEVAAVGLGITRPNCMVLVMGTSQCHQYMSPLFAPFPGLCSVVKDGMVPGYYAYEAGQCAVGDIYDWFIRNCVPASYFEEASARGISIYDLMNTRAAAIPAGESGLVALDWLNGNRSILMNYDLTGLILGLTLRTTPEEIYKALVESTAFGTRRILEAFKENGMAIDEVVATGGLALKAPFVVQTFADILGMPVQVFASGDAGPLGSAVCAHVALETVRTGKADFTSAVERLVHQKVISYKPNEASIETYDKLYGVYRELHGAMGEASHSAMKTLRAIQTDAKK